MWKPGQLVNLNGDVYRITKTCFTSRYRACNWCQARNGECPCVIPYTHVAKRPKTNFTLLTCARKMPQFCIPVKLRK